MSWSDFMAHWNAEPAAATTTPVRDLALGALAEAIVTRRVGLAFLAEECADCTPGRLCADHREDLAAAREYEAAYMRVARIGSDGAFLEMTGGLTL